MSIVPYATATALTAYNTWVANKLLAGGVEAGSRLFDYAKGHAFKIKDKKNMVSRKRTRNGRTTRRGTKRGRTSRGNRSRPTTFQSSVRTLYSRGKTSRRGAKRQKRSYKSYLRNTIKTLGKEKFMFEQDRSYTLPAGSTTTLTFMVGTGCDTYVQATGGLILPDYNKSGSDLINCMNILQNSESTLVSKKMILSHMVHDIEITLTTGSSEGSNQKVYIDIYKIMCRRTSAESAEESYEQGYEGQRVLPPPAGSTTLTTTNLGFADFEADPFKQSGFGRDWKISNVKRVVLGGTVSQNTSWQQSIKRDRVIARRLLMDPTDTEGVLKAGYQSLKGLTQGYLILMRNTDLTNTKNITVKSSRTYTCAEMHDNETTMTKVVYIPDTP